MNPGFAALEMEINTAKGYVFSKGVNPASTYFRNKLVFVEDWIKMIQNFFMLFDILRDHSFEDMFDVTNDRVYQAFLDIDSRIVHCGLSHHSSHRPMSANWASKYRRWMEDWLRDIGPPVWSWVDSAVKNLEYKLGTATGSMNFGGRTLDRYQINEHLRELQWIKEYPAFYPGHFRIEFELSWDTGRVPKRDLSGFDYYMKGEEMCGVRPQSTFATAIAGSTGLSPSRTGISGSASKSLLFVLILILSLV